MKILILLTLTNTILANALTAKMNSKSLKEIDHYINETIDIEYKNSEVLFVFDIDNTLLAMNQDLGSDQWFNWKKNNLSKKSEFSTLLKWQEILFNLGHMRLVDKESVSLIKKRQLKGDVIALTSRSPSYRSATLRELDRYNISFRHSSLASEFIGTKKSQSFLRGLSFSEGVIMSSGHNKGEVLKSLLKEKSHRYKQIVFFDDHSKHTDNFYKTFIDSGLDVFVIRYGKEDENVREFNNENDWKIQTDSKLKRLRDILISVFGSAPALI